VLEFKFHIILLEKIHLHYLIIHGAVWKDRVLGGQIQQVECSYRETEAFDWYQKYSGVKDIITQYVKKTYNILHAGAGNSSKTLTRNERGNVRRRI
jgi:hypothetical protein